MPIAWAGGNLLPSLNPQWKVPLTLQPLNKPYHTEESSSPVVNSNGRFLYAGTSDGRVHMVNTLNGQIVWTIDIKGGPILAPVALVNGERILAVVTIEGNVVALDAASGKELWRHRGESGFMTSPVGNGARVPLGVGTSNTNNNSGNESNNNSQRADQGKGQSEGEALFVLDEGGVLTALHMESGQQLWQYRRSLPEGFRLLGSPAPVLLSSALLVGFPDGALVSVATASGEENWVSTGAGTPSEQGSRSAVSGGPGAKGTLTDISTSPLLSPSGDVVYVAAFDQGIRAVSIDNGATQWRSEPVSGITGLALQPLFHLPAQPLAQAHAQSNSSPIPQDAPITIIATTSRGELLRFDARDGNILTENRVVEGSTNGLMVQSSNYALVWGPDVGLIQVRTDTGQTVNTINPGTGVMATPALFQDRVYTLSNGGVLYAFQIIPR